MFNLNWYNVALLVLLALFIFGDKLPKVISDGLRMLRNLRRMAQNATTDLNQQLGTDLQLEDLHPKTFVRKHLLSEQEQERLLAPIREVSEDVVRQTRGVQDDLREVGRRTERVTEQARQAVGRKPSEQKAAPQPRGEQPPPGDGISETGTGSAAAAGASAAGTPAAGTPTRSRTNYDDIT